MKKLVTSYRGFVALLITGTIVCQTFITERLETHPPTSAPHSSAAASAENSTASSPETVAEPAPSRFPATGPVAHNRWIGIMSNWFFTLVNASPAVKEFLIHFIKFGAVAFVFTSAAYLYSRLFWRVLYRKYCFDGDYLALSKYSTLFKQNCNEKFLSAITEPDDVALKLTIDQDVFHAVISEGSEIPLSTKENAADAGDQNHSRRKQGNVDRWESLSLTVTEKGNEVVLSYEVERTSRDGLLGSFSHGIEVISVKEYEEFFLFRWASLRHGTFGRWLQNLLPFLHGRPKLLVGRFFAYSGDVHRPAPLYSGITIYERFYGVKKQNEENELQKILDGLKSKLNDQGVAALPHPSGDGAPAAV
jgi:hypothetical protein